MLEFVGNLGAVPSCCFAMFCRGPTLGTSGGDRDFWILEGAQVGRFPGAFRETVVVCAPGGGEPRGVGDTLGLFRLWTRQTSTIMQYSTGIYVGISTEKIVVRQS
jgi:hypothetical protein